jgi:hypothetical protein
MIRLVHFVLILLLALSLLQPLFFFFILLPRTAVRWLRG